MASHLKDKIFWKNCLKQDGWEEKFLEEINRGDDEIMFYGHLDPHLIIAEHDPNFDTGKKST